MRNDKINITELIDSAVEAKRIRLMKSNECIDYFRSLYCNEDCKECKEECLREYREKLEEELM